MGNRKGTNIGRPLDNGWLFNARHNRYGKQIDGLDAAVVIVYVADPNSGWNRHWKVYFGEIFNSIVDCYAWVYEDEIAAFTSLKIAMAFAETLGNAVKKDEIYDHNARRKLMKSYEEEIKAYHEMEKERVHRQIIRKAAYKLPEGHRPKTDEEWKAFDGAFQMAAFIGKARHELGNDAAEKLEKIMLLNALKSAISKAMNNGDDDEEDD